MKNSKYYRLKRVSDKNRIRLNSIEEDNRMKVKAEVTNRLKNMESESYRRAYRKMLEDYNNANIIVKIWWRIDEVFEWLCEKLYRL